jgi:hypothetical protein
MGALKKYIAKDNHEQTELFRKKAIYFAVVDSEN